MRVGAMGVAALVLLAACSEGKSQPQAEGGDALAQLRAQLDGQRQCAPLLSGTTPIEFSADALSGPKVDALVAAGLVRRVPLPATGDRPRMRIEPTSEGSRDIWLRRLDPTSPAEPLLCYGRKQVVAVHPEGKDTLRYDYRVGQAPAWTGRTDIRAAFPFLARQLSEVHRAEQVATREDGRWVLAGDTGRDASAELPPSEGFFPQ
ncbi:hypothetical protein [Sphingomonas sanguinis]|uniref:Lipoprotein n=1 Tax=Sphingomonas sanguinis TaxID=33051 RepID=A0A147J5W8_9SPHN|nr:hypothetical protein [Sphingomonas sanguinis]KTW09915.1 hypothetical protein NS258_14120 [Sphingomonas sanguinis]